MADVEFRTKTVTIGPKSGEPTDSTVTTDAFSGTVLEAQACQQSWDISFSGDDDHEYYQSFVKVMKLDINPENTVTITYQGGLRDKSGEWDDDYICTVTFLVIAKVSSN